MRKIRLTAGLAALLMLGSCGDNFFKLEPNYEVPVGKLETAEDFNVEVMGCYAKLQSQVNFYLECCEYRSDNLYLDAPTTGTQDRYDIDQFKDVASNGILETYWANFNNGVYRCNLLLDQIAGADIDPVIKAQYQGEAMFLRSFTYFNMYRTWGGVPTTRRVVTVEEALKIGRSSNEQMYELIAGDLQQIIDKQMLPAAYQSSADLGRATIGAAKALLAKVHLTFGKAREAATLLEGMIGSYALLQNVADVFDVNNKMNEEIVFAVRFNKQVVDEGHGYWYSITNLTDDSGQSATLKNLYESGDARKSLIEYVKVPNVNICLMRKFYDTPDATTNRVGNDQIIIRYADVLLMYAEAMNEVAYSSDPASPALEALNAVHTRAGLAPIKISELPDQTAFRQAIMKERQMEFPYEGQRWFDLVRMGGAVEQMAAAGHSIQEWQFLYGIPTTELERINDTSLLWQNPGY